MAPVIAAIIAVGAVFGLMGIVIGRLTERHRPAAGPDLARIGGTLIDRKDWPPEIISKIQELYFSVPASDELLVRVDISGNCPAGHLVRERVGVFGRKESVVQAIAEDLHKGRSVLLCHECGKQTRASSRQEIWRDKLSAWDGAT